MTGKQGFVYLAVMFTLLFVLGACGSDPVPIPNSSAPSITSFSPATATAGDTLTITGTGFSTTPASNTVAFNGTPATVTSCTSTQIVVAVPAGATSGTITVTVGGVTATSSSTLTVTSGTGTAGTLDTTFGGGTGYVTTTIDGLAHAIAMQADGKILAAGSGTNATVVRYNTDGTLDTGFGTAGIATLPSGSTELSIINSLALDGSGKIVVAGIGTSGGFFRMAAARLNSDGSLDTTFGASGIFYSPFTSNGSYGAQDVAIQADGKIVLVGETADKFAVVRLNTDGTRDTAGFGAGIGYVTTVIPGSPYAHKVAIQADGKIVVMGYTYNAGAGTTVVAKYNTDGTLDTAGFGAPNGYVTNTGLSSPEDMALQSGKIVVGGSTIVGPIFQFAMLRFNADGTIDSTFGTSGLVTTPVGGVGVSGEAYSMALTGTGIILAGHVSTTLTSSQIGVARYSANGVLDTTFGNPDGYVLTTIGTSPYPYATAIDGNGKIVVAGGQGSGTSAYFVVRYLP